MSDAGTKLAELYGSARTRIVVEEWAGVIPADSEGEPAIYARPYTLADQKQLARFVERNDPEGFAEVIVRKAEDEDGNRLFDKGDKPTLMTAVPQNMLAAIAEKIIASVTLDDAKKKSNGLTSSPDISWQPDSARQ